MDLPPLWTTHLIAFAVGVATWLPFTLWEGRRVTEEQVMSDESTTTHRRRRVPRLALIIIVSSAFIVGFGIQQARYQHERDQRDKCIARYNTDTEKVRDGRIAVNETLADAQTAKSNAGDDVLLTTLDLIRQPRTDQPGQQELVSQLTHDLIRFARKKHRLDVTQQETETALAEQPYPTLDC